MPLTIAGSRNSCVAPIEKSDFIVSLVSPYTVTEPVRLDGLSIIVTRPRNTADALVRRLQRGGAHVLRLPGQSIHANADFDWAAALQRRHSIECWIFNSPSAVIEASPLLEAGLGGKPVYAVGAGTSRALRRHGIHAIAPSRQQDSEGLLELDGLRDIQGQRLALISAPGGRGLVAAGLRDRGALLDVWSVYRREPARWTPRQLDAISHADDPLVSLVSSAETLQHLHRNLPTALWQKLRDAGWVVSSSRLAAQLHGFGANDVAVANSAGASDLIAAIGSVTKR